VRPYLWHGTTTLFAALETATGKVTGACYPRHRHEEFLQSSGGSRRPISAGNCTSSRTLRHAPVPGREGVACGEPRTRRSFTSARDLIAAIENFIHGWNDRCQPLHLDQDARRVNAALPAR
jgi:hypothetical protein